MNDLCEGFRDGTGKTTVRDFVNGNGQRCCGHRGAQATTTAKSPTRCTARTQRTRGAHTSTARMVQTSSSGSARSAKAVSPGFPSEGSARVLRVQQRLDRSRESVERLVEVGDLDLQHRLVALRSPPQRVEGVEGVEPAHQRRSAFRR